MPRMSDERLAGLYDDWCSGSPKGVDEVFEELRAARTAYDALLAAATAVVDDWEADPSKQEDDVIAFFSGGVTPIAALRAIIKKGGAS